MMRPLSPRVQAGLVLAVVALLGALLGVLGDRLIAQRTGNHPMDDVMHRPGMRRGGPGRPAGMARYADRLAEHLDLTPSQRTAIDSILAEEQRRVRELTADFQPRFRSIALQTRERVEAVLTPEQREALRAMRRQRMRGLGDERPLLRDSPASDPGRP